MRLTRLEVIIEPAGPGNSDNVLRVSASLNGKKYNQSFLVEENSPFYISALMNHASRLIQNMIKEDGCSTQG